MTKNELQAGVHPDAMEPGWTSCDVLIIGAGLCGVLIGRGLREQLDESATEKSRNVIIWDKGRAVGGRMATRRVGHGAHGALAIGEAQTHAIADHGAQFFTMRDERTRVIAAEWAANGWIRPWPAFSANAYGDTRWVSVGGMNALVKKLAEPLGQVVQTSVHVQSVGLSATGEYVISAKNSCDEQLICLAKHVILTPPVPQSLHLVGQGQLPIPEPTLQKLHAIEYAPCIAFLIECNRPQTWVLPMLQSMNWPDGVRFLADNQQKGISDRPVLTVHMDTAWSNERYEWTDDQLETAIRAVLDTYLPSTDVLSMQVKKWRYSQAVRTEKLPYVSVQVDGARGKLVFAGDAFASEAADQAGRVENAMLSALAVIEAPCFDS